MPLVRNAIHKNMLNKTLKIGAISARNKKLALVTWFGSFVTGSNYGTSLQSFALQYKLSVLGYDVLIIPERQKSDWLTLLVRPEYFLHLLATCSLFGLAKQAMEKMYTFLFNSRSGEIDNSNVSLCYQKCLRWEERHYKIATFNSRKEWRRYINGVSCFVSGSDQLWNTYNTYSPFWFLGFTRGKKISYASSIGTKSINPKYKERVRSHLTQFQHISVREECAIEELGELTGRSDICHVVDPTFLVTAEEWSKISMEEPLSIELPDRYLLCYLLAENEEYASCIKKVMQASSIESVVVVRSVENPTFSVEGCIDYGIATPSEFVALIRNASLVCTDSFHGTAIAINNSVPFVEFKRFRDDDIKSQNSRIYGLLEQFGLTSRFYDGNTATWCDKIDYRRINHKLDKMRAASLEYLVNAIEN